MFVRAYNCWLHSPPALSLAVGQYAVTIMVRKLFFPRSSVNHQRPRVRNYWPITIDLNDTSSIAMVSVPPLWNGPSELATLLFPVLTLLFKNHPSVLLYILSFMEILIQLLFTSASPTIDITSLVMIFFKVSNLCWLGWSDLLPILPMFWKMIIFLPFLLLPQS